MVATTSASKPFRVAIIGAGIGGLATAIALARLIPEGAVMIDIYEQAREIKEIGAGIAFWTRTWPIFRRLGIFEELEKHLERKIDNEKTLPWKVIKSDKAQWDDIFEFYKTGQCMHPIHRAAVQKTMLDALPPSVQVHLSYSLLSYDESEDHVTLNFEGYPSHECDILVAADGIKSCVRAQFISKRLPDQQRSINPVWGGTTAYRSLVDADKIKQKFPEHIALSKIMMYAGQGKFAVSYPIMQGRFIAFSALSTDYSKKDTTFDGPTSNEADKDYILSLFSGWSEEFLSLIKSADTCFQWTIQYLSPLRSFAVGRVALLGDAAHAMMPTMGSGAGQAIEDAYILAQLLSKAVEDNIPIHRVTDAYTKTRQPLANLVLQKSYDLAQLITFRKQGYEGIDDADQETMKQLFRQFALDFEQLFDWWEMYPIEAEVEKALNMLL
ncbi:hypothetical protein BDQ17DRAFT_1371746 [Cyathus striatus]|nr:hypothetical protein BDQ17DRAFT_1371746 [Cyathus striatus]